MGQAQLLFSLVRPTSFFLPSSTRVGLPSLLPSLCSIPRPSVATAPGLVRLHLDPARALHARAMSRPSCAQAAPEPLQPAPRLPEPCSRHTRASHLHRLHEFRPCCPHHHIVAINRTMKSPFAMPFNVLPFQTIPKSSCGRRRRSCSCSRCLVPHPSHYMGASSTCSYLCTPLKLFLCLWSSVVVEFVVFPSVSRHLASHSRHSIDLFVPQTASPHVPETLEHIPTVNFTFHCSLSLNSLSSASLAATQSSSDLPLE